MFFNRNKKEKANIDIETIKPTVNGLDKTVIMYGYKATDKNMKCRDYQYTMLEPHIIEGSPELCSHGFHFCKNITDINNFYTLTDVDCENRVFQVSTYGTNAKSDDVKTTTDNITFLKEISRNDIDKAFGIVRENDFNGNLIFFSNENNKIVISYTYDEDNNFILQKKTESFVREEDNSKKRNSEKNKTYRDWVLQSVNIKTYGLNNKVTSDSTEYNRNNQDYHYNNYPIKSENIYSEYIDMDGSYIRYKSESSEYYNSGGIKTTSITIDSENKRFISTVSTTRRAIEEKNITEIYVSDMFRSADKPYYQSKWVYGMAEGTVEEYWTDYPIDNEIYKSTKSNGFTYVILKNAVNIVDHIIDESDRVIKNSVVDLVKYLTDVTLENEQFAGVMYNRICRLIKSTKEYQFIELKDDRDELVKYNLVETLPFNFLRLTEYGFKINEMIKTLRR